MFISAGADEKPQKIIRQKLRAVHGNGSGGDIGRFAEHKSPLI